MRTCGFSESDQVAIFGAVAAVLQMGNIKFQAMDSKPDASELVESSRVHLDAACNTLGVDADSLEQALCTRSFTGKEHGTFVVVPLSPDAARATRDTLAQTLYKMLFAAIVRKVNVAIGQEEDVDLSCGILDIFGFECFKMNSLEQLCINFANEELQQCFINFVFRRETELYQSEGVPWNPIDVPDNKDVLSLYMEKNIGLFSMLHEECNLPKGSDAQYNEKVWKRNAKNKRLIVLPHRVEFFTVNHYAGKVEYFTKGFLEKNQAKIANNCIHVMCESSNSFVGDAFNSLAAELDEGSAGTNLRRSQAAGKNTKQTLVIKFQSQMADLMQKINCTDPHFIRCIKPTPMNKPNMIDDDHVMAQLRTGGVIQAIQVSRAGYPVRMNHKDCWHEYAILARKGAPGGVEHLEAFLQDLDSRFHLSAKEPAWALGKNVVFIKQVAYERLNEEHLNKLNKSAAKIQAVQKGRLQRRHVAEMRRAVVPIQTAMRGFLARKRLKEKREDKRRNEAAVKIQALARGRHGRQQAKEFRRERWMERKSRLQARLHAAARLMQAAVRGNRGHQGEDLLQKLGTEKATFQRTKYRSYISINLDEDAATTATTTASEK